MQDELEVMGKVAKLLEPLEAAARSRVLGWVISALDVRGTSGIAAGLGAANRRAGLGDSSGAMFSTFADLFHAASPQTEKEKALVAAYWIQSASGNDQFVAQQLNTELKNIGYGVSNITDALNQLIADRPNFVIQLSKSGNSKQSRKTYKITDAGMRRVSEMLDASAGDEK